jgi:hypothetical protein
MRLHCYLLLAFMLFNLVEISAQVSRKFEYPMNKVTKIDIDDEMPANTTGTPSYTITFSSKDSFVYAIDSGEAVEVRTVEDAFLVIIKDKDSNYVYSNLKSVAVKKGDKITNGQVIGYADFDPDKDYYLLDMIITDRQNILQLKKKNFVPRSM